MRPATPTERTFASGYPIALDELRRQIASVEPDVVIGLWAMLKSAEMSVSFSEAEIISGQATQFVYRCDAAECQSISFLPPVDTLFKSLEVTWKEVTPSDASTAYLILKEWVGSGSPVVARFKEPLLVYGFSVQGSFY